MSSRLRLFPVAAVAFAAASVALALPGTAAAPEAGQVVLLKSRALSSYDQAAAGFRETFRGTVSEITLEEGAEEAIEKRIAALRPDAVVAIGLRAALFARDHTAPTPLVFCAVQQPEKHDLTAVWITGVATDVSPAAELQALRDAAPGVRRVAVIHGTGRGLEFGRRARAAAQRLGFELVDAAVPELSDLARVAREAASRADALWLPADPDVATPESFHFLLELSLVSRKPLLVFSHALVRAGALAAASPDYAVAGTQAAEALRRILAGERAGDIPVIPVRRTRVVLNRTTARALGLDLAPEILETAEVLE